MLSDFQQMLAPDPEMMSFKPEKLGSRFDTRLLHAHIMTKLLQLCIAFMTASSTAAPAFADKFHLPPAPTQTGKSFFFASSRACVSSGQFSAQECADAFDRVSALLHEHARKFAAEIDCVMKFKLSGARRGDRQVFERRHGRADARGGDAARNVARACACLRAAARLRR